MVEKKKKIPETPEPKKANQLTEKEKNDIELKHAKWNDKQRKKEQRKTKIEERRKKQL